MIMRNKGLIVLYASFFSKVGGVLDAKMASVSVQRAMQQLPSHHARYASINLSESR